MNKHNGSPIEGKAKLAYLTNFFPSLTETFIYREVMEIRRRGKAVAIYSLRRPDRSGISMEAEELYASTYYLLPVPKGQVLYCHGVSLLRAPCKYLRTLWKMLTPRHKRLKDRVRSLLHFGEGVVLAERFLRDGISHIHAHYASQSTSVARVIHFLTGIPYSFTGHAHDIWHDQLLLPEKLDEAVFIATCSRFGKNWLLKCTDRDVSNKVHVVYHGLDVTSFVPPGNGSGREKNLILSIGRLTAQKGFPDLISACAIMKGKGFETRCIVIGEGEERDRLQMLVKEAGLEKEVFFIGSVRQEKIRGYLERAWVFVLPCVDTVDGNRDGIPNVLMEAMAMGVPVITTANAGQAELIENGITGMLVPQHSPESLAEATMELCGNDELRRSIERLARKKMENDFDNRKTIIPLMNLFERYVFQDSRPVPGTPAADHLLTWGRHLSG